MVDAAMTRIATWREVPSAARTLRALRLLGLAGLLAASAGPILPTAASAAPAGGEVSFREVAEVFASDALDDDFYGESVAIAGDTVVVGSPSDDETADRGGAVFVFERDAGGFDAWGEVVKLTASDGAKEDELGSSVGIDGDYLVAAARLAHSAYIFERDAAGNWTEAAKLLPSNPTGFFGTSAALDGDTAVVTADHGGDGDGAAYVFQRNATGGWDEVAELTASDADPDDLFGNAVAVDGDTVVVGSYHDDDVDDSGGAAYVFERNAGGADNWGEVVKLLSSDISFLDEFGFSVAIDGDTAVVGAHFDDSAANGSGSAYVFERDAGGAGNWGEVAHLFAADGGNLDSFGESVGISGDTIVVGAINDDDLGESSGAAYFFQRDAGGPGAWGRVAKGVAFDGTSIDLLGWSVAVDGDTAAVGAPGIDDIGFAAADEFSGTAYVFQETTVAPSVTVSGSCPGQVRVAVSGLTPKGRGDLYGSSAEGTDTVADGPCVGTALSLVDPVRVRQGKSESGSTSGNLDLLAGACGAFFQVVDLTSCAVTDTVPAP